MPFDSIIRVVFMHVCCWAAVHCTVSYTFSSCTRHATETLRSYSGQMALEMQGLLYVPSS